AGRVLELGALADAIGIGELVGLREQQEAVRTAESVVLVPDFAAHLVGGRPVHLTVRSGQGPHLAVAAGESGLHGLGLVSVGLTEACRNLFAVRPHATRGNLVVGVVGSPPLLFELRSLTTLGNGPAIPLLLGQRRAWRLSRHC